MFLNSSNNLCWNLGIRQSIKMQKKKSDRNHDSIQWVKRPCVPTVNNIQPLPDMSKFTQLLKHIPIFIHAGHRKKNSLTLIKLTDSQSGVLPKNDGSRTKSVLVSSSPKHDEALVIFSLKFHKVLQTKQASCQSVGPKCLKQSTNLSFKKVKLRSH